jgi:hypothetical protein
MLPGAACDGERVTRAAHRAPEEGVDAIAALQYVLDWDR